MCSCGSCNKIIGDRVSPNQSAATTSTVNNYTDFQEKNHEKWIVSNFWQQNMLPGMMKMSGQMSATGMDQIMIVGTFLDAKNQLETQRVLETIRARAHKDYHPSVGMCEFGSAIKSLAASERKAELAAHIMSQRSQDRQTGNANTASAGGGESDKAARSSQYQTKFCDPSDNNAGLGELCKDGAKDKSRVNKDIDFVRTVEFPWTLNADFSDQTLTDNEEELLALQSNIYGSDLFKNVPKIGNTSKKEMSASQANYMDARALMAKRSVAENSFNAITSMKTSGSAGSRDFLKAILKDLGVSEDKNTSKNISSLDRLLGVNEKDGKTIAPSYYAQMEVLTKKIYQNPDFYTNLYDKPANVERKAVAMQAIGLMQKFDLFKSYLRTEANLSVLLELAVQDIQGEPENAAANQAR